jgi:hydrogenase maturation protein HypF
MKIRYKLTIYGIVQGVGFRPFIHKLVKKYNLYGWICNSNQGVEMEIEGEESDGRKFLKELKNHLPPLALIDDIRIERLSPIGYSKFVIKKSKSNHRHPVILMPPDISICEDCITELNDPSNRRYHYPFINCTNCGPRFTIIEDMPYDRDKTTMKNFVMCTDCYNEYHDLENRRYHAQPNACPVCGPQVSLYTGNQKVVTQDPIQEAQKRLRGGEVGVIKGLGGFHLSCDAQNKEAVSRIREIKKRDQKPFALMAESISKITNFCYVSELARKYLESKEKPIVLLKKKRSCHLSPDIAPGNAYLGFMLPYTPLHILLLQKSSLVLVMTSANFSDEPIIIQNEEAFQKLVQQVDFLLLHNRQIYNRCDDSVLKITAHHSIFIRRSRGYAPFPIVLPEETESILALGPEEKNTVCLTRDRYAFPSQHLGDLKNRDSFQAYQEAIKRLIRVFQFKPKVIACDLHPDYLSTHYAEELSQQFRVPLLKIQHHHAHIASCTAENHISEKVIGVALDGTGFGLDGAIWGGEFLVVSPKDCLRVGHLKYIAMPGGEQAIHQPWRMAFSYLYPLFGQEADSIHSILGEGREKKEFQLLKQMIDKRINSPLTSSCGRLFDAVASLIGLRDEVDFEGQAAMELEALCQTKYKDNYNYKITREITGLVVDTGEMFLQIINDLERKIPLPRIATQFHNTVADIILSLCVKIKKEFNINYVALSGGVFQNSFLLTQTMKKLKKENFKVLIHKKLPPNDACIALGQAVVVNARIKSGKMICGFQECK